MVRALIHRLFVSDAAAADLSAGYVTTSAVLFVTWIF